MDRLTNDISHRNTSKKIHLVFQVMNFLTSEDSLPYSISNDEWKCLVILASHNSLSGMWPSMPTLAKKLHVTVRSVEKTISKMRNKGLIDWLERRGRSNLYSFPFLATPVVCDGGEKVTPPSSVTGVPPSCSSGVTPVVYDGQVVKSFSKSNKSFYKAENEKPHDWAQMKNEQASIARSEAHKLEAGQRSPAMEEAFKIINRKTKGI